MKRKGNITAKKLIVFDVSIKFAPITSQHQPKVNTKKGNKNRFISAFNAVTSLFNLKPHYA